MTIACYARKSTDKENDSIENQISIIRNYISKQKDFQGAKIVQFTDSGASGIDMNRNAFQELLSKVKLREIDVVVVKDLSRLGRNYLDVCKLTDSIFPFMGVRLIAVSENYDSNYRVINSIDLPTAFQSVLNEYYVMELSKKVRNSCVLRIKNGEFIGSIPYGYILKDRFTPVIDTKKAKIVREIFSLYLEKKNCIDVVRILNKRGIKTNKNSKWTSVHVRKILKNEKYTGKRVALTHRKDLKTRKKILTDKNEWHIDEHAFPPIISHEIFEEVQKFMPKGEIHNVSEKHIMARKLYCAKCGKTLKRNVHFYCKSSYQTGEKPCFKGSLKRDFLYRAVLEKVKKYISADIPECKSNFSFSDIVKIESEITSLKEKKAEIFEQLFNGDIMQTEFEKQNWNISSQITAKQNELQLCRRALALNTKYGSECPLDTLKRLYVTDELTKEHMQFVKRINVFDSEHFEIIMQSDSPLSVLCKNMDIYDA
ncbi:MAG: recombinase family protein [Ruminococcus sp.]|nr:recombinase family protein [Ruminococcus sp.]